jgi:hypothetical protein
MAPAGGPPAYINVGIPRADELDRPQAYVTHRLNSLSHRSTGLVLTVGKDSRTVTYRVPTVGRLQG